MKKENYASENNSENDLTEKLEALKKATNKVRKAKELAKKRMLLVIAFLEIKIEEEKSEEKNNDVIAFYKELKNEVVKLYNSKPKADIELIAEDFAIDKLNSYFISGIDSILALILAQECKIRLK